MIHSDSTRIVLLQKIWQAFSGLVTALLVTYFLSSKEQGVYYAFGSLLSGYILLDLGLSGLLVQVSARMFPGLKLQGDGHISPDGLSRSAFLSMMKWSKRWYIRIGFVSLVLIPVGFLYFSSANADVSGMEWRWPWVFIVISIALSMPAYPFISIIEGTGRVTEAYLVRLAHYGLGALLAWSLMAGGEGLYAPAMAPLSVAVIVRIWLYFRYRKLTYLSRQVSSAFSWRENIWPLQRRVAITWLSSYIFLYSPTLVVFYYLDAPLAGQLGLSIVIANVIGSLCTSSLTARVPRITHLVVQGDICDSNKIFISEFRKAIALIILSYGIAILAIIIAGDSVFVGRILQLFDLVLLFSTFLVFHSISMIAIYFRARGREVLAITSIGAAVFSFLISCLVASEYGISGVLVSFLSVYGVVCGVGIFVVWRSNYGALAMQR